MEPIYYFKYILEVKRYSSNKIKNDGSTICKYRDFSEIPFKYRSERTIQDFVYHCVKTEHGSFSTQQQLIGALR